MDSKTNERVKIDSTFKLDCDEYVIDTLANCIRFKFHYLQKMTLYNSNYFAKEFSVPLKRKSNVYYQNVEPTQNYFYSKYKQYWENETSFLDTLRFNNNNDLQAYLLKQLTYIHALHFGCDNGLCSYSNTYTYVFSFQKNEDLYELCDVSKVRPWDYHCESLDVKLKSLITIFPKISFSEEESAKMLKYAYLIVPNY